ncbi:hypothetical protein D9M69_620810 [compost metagenome]
MELHQRVGQAAGGGALHAPQAQVASRPLRVHGLARFIGQGQQALAVIEEGLAAIGEGHALAVAEEERGAQLLFQLANPRGDVRLRPLQPLGGAGHTVLEGHRAENLQAG